MAIALATTAIHTSGRAEVMLLAGAVVLAALGALTKGPLAAFRVVAARTHRVLEVVAAAVLMAAPLASLHQPSLVAIGLLELAGLVLLRLAYGGVRPPRPAPSVRSVRPITRGAPARVVSMSARPAGAAPVLDAGARAAGRAAGRARRKVAEAAPVAEVMLGRGARRLGAAVGRRSARRRSA